MCAPLEDIGRIKMYALFINIIIIIIIIIVIFIKNSFYGGGGSTVWGAIFLWGNCPRTVIIFLKKIK